MSSILDFLNSPLVVGYFSAAMRLAIPIMLAALGGVYNERSGVMNIGMEGMMLMGSLVGFVVGFYANNIWLGILAAAASGVILGIVLAFFTVTLSADQVVAGIAINLLSVGLTSFLYRVFFGVDSQMAHINAAYTTPIPFLEKIPILGPLFFQQSPLVYFTFVLIGISYIVITRTSWGLQITAVGENPEAAETLGMNVQRTRYITMIISGILSAIGGAFLSLVATHLFLDNMTAGRGYIALAILVLGRRHPLGILLAALMFGGADALQLRAQTMNIGIPFQYMLMLPYLLTMIVLAIFVKKTDNPAALGVPYNPNRGESE